MEVPIGIRVWPAVVAAMAAMLLPFAVVIPNAPNHVTFAWVAVPLVAGVVLPFPVAAWVAAATSRGRVRVAGGRLDWDLEERNGHLDLAQPFVLDAWVEPPDSEDVVWVVLRVTQGTEAVAVAYTTARTQAPALPVRNGERPVFLIASWRARRAWEALEAALRATPGVITA